jgi:hypothetical protein
MGLELDAREKFGWTPGWSGVNHLG